MNRLIAALVIATAAPVAAHIVAVPASGAAGSYHALAMRVGHGCGDAATTAVKVELPPGLTIVRPQPKPGWTIRIDKAPMPAPATVEGRQVTERIAAITWTGNLPADQFDDFGLLIKLPDIAGTMQLPVEQRCGTTVQRWDGSDARHPAPGVEATAATPTHSH